MCTIRKHTKNFMEAVTRMENKDATVYENGIFINLDVTILKNKERGHDNAKETVEELENFLEKLTCLAGEEYYLNWEAEDHTLEIEEE